MPPQFTIASEPDVTGITMVLDRFSGLIRDEFKQNARYVTAVQIGWGLPLVWDNQGVMDRIAFYKGLGVKVSMSGTLVEHSMVQGTLNETLSSAKEMGFDLVEVSDGIIGMSSSEKANLAEQVRKRGFEVMYNVGKKDPTSQASPRELMDQIEAGLKLKPYKVVLESRERGRGVGIFDDDGNVKWRLLRSITSVFDHRLLVFQAPTEQQQAALIMELGPEVNLANVSLGSIATLQAERLGLRFDTFGIDRPRDEVKGGPSVKFVLYAVRNYQPIDQPGIAAVTQLPRRTIQKALEVLVESHLVTETPSLEDRRSKIYRTSTTSPMERFR